MEFWERNVSFHICQPFDNLAWINTVENKWEGCWFGVPLTIFPVTPNLTFPKHSHLTNGFFKRAGFVGLPGQNRAGLGKADGWHLRTLPPGPPPPPATWTTAPNMPRAQYLPASSRWEPGGCRRQGQR